MFKREDPFAALTQEQHVKRSILTETLRDKDYVSPFRGAAAAGYTAGAAAGSAHARKPRRFSASTAGSASSSDSDSDELADEQADKHADKQKDSNSFRKARPVYNKNAKNAKFPTVSATGELANKHPRELGYKTLSKDTKRAKDISFPTYLTENEARQQVILKELDLKEEKLAYLKSCQLIQDLTVKQDDDDDDDDEAEGQDNGDETETEDADETGTVTEPAAADENGVEPVSEVEPAAADENGVEPVTEVKKPNVEPVAEAAEVVEEEEVVEGSDAASAAVTDTDTESYLTVATPAPYQKAPKLPYEDVPEKQNRLGGFFKKSHESNLSAAYPVISDVPVIPAQQGFDFPIATPENQEVIAKTEEYGYMSKPVYDKVVYDESKHRRWLKDFRKTEKVKYDDKMTEYNSELDELQKEIDMIYESMEKLKGETAAKIEVSENDLVKKIFERNQVHNERKNKIFKDTENLKNQKIKEKDAVLSKQSEVQKEIDELQGKKAGVRDEFNKWTTDMTVLGQQLDAKVMKVTQINMKQQQTQKDIEKLEEQKKQYELEIEAAKKKHQESQKVVESYENKEYLPKIHEFDSQISTLLNELAMIKQENANEQTELSNITKKLEEERRAHEEKLKLEAEERERQEKNLLEKQKLELSAKAEQQKKEHEEQLRKIREDHETELQAVKKQKESLETEKLVKEHKANESLKNEVLEKQRRQAEAQHAAQTKDTVPSSSNDLQDNSIFEYKTEEEVMYV